MPLYPVETVRRVELEPSSVTKIPVTVKGDPKGCWILEPGFPDCRFVMPSAVMGQVKRNMFGLSMMLRVKCMCLKGLLWE